LSNEEKFMKRRSLTVTLLLATIWLPILAEAKSKAPPLPERNPKRAAAPATPKRLHPSEVQTSPWSDGEVAAAKTKCTETLSGVRLDFEPLPPLQQGPCGTPAPILLRSLGVDPKVELEPPATVSCELAKALSEWVGAVQREAKELLGSAVLKLRASSYACRNIYHRANPPLSQHALANALDVSGFVLASGELITVREDWRNRSVQLASAEGSLPPFVTAIQQKSQFVMNAHADACSIFGTVLGPRANRSHKDHFHLDMKQRDRSLCR
jgi:hypothetical protein